MSENKNNTRRQFLRNTALASLSLGLIPLAAKAKDVSTKSAPPPCNTTTLDYYGQGPFYKENAPEIVNNQLVSGSEPGTRLILSGVVQTLDCTKVIPNTKIDVWQADSAGAYDNAGYDLRGVTYSNAQGFYMFETVLPGKYLNGSKYRPKHLHFKITPEGFPTLITQLYFEGDSDIPGDAAASITSGNYDATHRIIPITLNGQGKYEGVWDIALDGNGVLDSVNMHADKGIIYSVSPNPFQDEITIHYGIFQASLVSVQIFDMQGVTVAELDQKQLSPQKYEATWKPSNYMSAGTYFVALKLNDLQVHYLKIVKQ